MPGACIHIRQTRHMAQQASERERVRENIVMNNSIWFIYSYIRGVFVCVRCARAIPEQAASDGRTKTA